MATSEIIVQSVIGVIGIFGELLNLRKSRWIFPVGLISQPFWIYSTFTHGQWGIFSLTLMYCAIRIRGCYLWFYKYPRAAKP